MSATDQSMLTDAQAWNLLFLYINGYIGICPRVSQYALADRYKCGQGTISRYIRVYSVRFVKEIQERVSQKPPYTTMEEIYRECASSFRQSELTVRATMVYGLGIQYQYLRLDKKNDLVKRYQLEGTIAAIRKMKRTGPIVNRITTA